MHFSIWAATAISLARSALAYDPYNITANYVINNKNYYARTWYGDGELYIGTTIPEGVTTVTDFTGMSAHLLQLTYITHPPPTRKETIKSLT